MAGKMRLLLIGAGSFIAHHVAEAAGRAKDVLRVGHNAPLDAVMTQVDVAINFAIAPEFFPLPMPKRMILIAARLKRRLLPTFHSLCSAHGKCTLWRTFGVLARRTTSAKPIQYMGVTRRSPSAPFWPLWADERWFSGSPTFSATNIIQQSQGAHSWR